MTKDKIKNIYTYEKSRELFRNRVSKNPSFKLNTLYINEEDDLTIGKLSVNVAFKLIFLE